METSAISYRVADFLKTHPPFQAVAETDLLELAAHGRVRFFEPREYLIWQGEPYKSHVFVIQQGTVSLWDETGGEAVLKDVRGPGDLLAIERFTDAACSLDSALSESDVVIYAFPASDFGRLILEYPHARQFVAALDTVTADYQLTKDALDPGRLFLTDLVAAGALHTCRSDDSIADVARIMLERGSEAVVAVDQDRSPQGVVTVGGVLAWVAAGAGTASAPVDQLLQEAPSVGPSATVVDGVLALADSGAGAIVMTSDGLSGGRVQAVVTAADTARAFGDDPSAIVRDVRRASTVGELRVLNHRARALILRQFTGAAALDWLARFAALVDHAMLTRIITLTGGELADACWCAVGASGRGESLTRHAPQLVVITGDDSGRRSQTAAYERVCDALGECDYLFRTDIAFDRAFHVAPVAEWNRRYRDWFGDPVRSSMYLARPLFDLRPAHGDTARWRDVTSAATAAIDGDFLQILANDCLASLPPLTFFQDAVIEKTGEHTTVFRLEESALRPLVDVGRVFGMGARHVFGTSTLERFTCAKSLLPAHQSIFRDAIETLRILLWQQARIGIDQGTSGSELPPALLSRNDRHVLKGAFKSILRLIELTGSTSWFAQR